MNKDYNEGCLVILGGFIMYSIILFILAATLQWLLNFFIPITFQQTTALIGIAYLVKAIFRVNKS